MLDHAFQFVQRVLFFVGEHNIRSQKAMEKIGGIRDFSVATPHASGGQSVCYVIKKPF